VIALAAWCWLRARPVPGLGYEFSVSPRVLRAAAVNFACFAAIAIPAALASGFARWNPRWRGAGSFCVDLVEIFVFIAWLEELLFRGFLQTLLSKTLRSPVAGQALASLAFGLSHVLLAPAPNWRYVALASLAGWFYGSAFRAGGNLMAPALTHALVDASWRTWFR
jgi:membrane protease YdiL (CAAX protease family)